MKRLLWVGSYLILSILGTRHIGYKYCDQIWLKYSIKNTLTLRCAFPNSRNSFALSIGSAWSFIDLNLSTSLAWNAIHFLISPSLVWCDSSSWHNNHTNDLLDKISCNPTTYVISATQWPWPWLCNTPMTGTWGGWYMW